MSRKKRQEIIVKVRNELISATGVDFNKYRTPEMFTKISELLVFPLYALPTIFGSVLATILLFAITYIAYLIHAPAFFTALASLVFGLPAFIALGVCIGFTLLIRRIASDIKLIICSATGLMKSASLDIQSSFANIAGKGSDAIRQIPTPSQLGKGILIVALLPSLEQAIQKRIKFIGGFVSGIVSGVLMNISESVFNIADEKSHEVRAVVTSSLDKIPENDRLKKLTDSVALFADKLCNVAEAVVGASCRKVAKPFILLAVLFGSVCLLVVFGMFGL